MMKIYGSPNSSSGRCYWCLEEAGVEYDAQVINFRENEHKSEAFLKVNPNGKVPALIDKDFVMSESVAINMYLAEKYKPELLGTTTEQRAKINQWSIWAIAELQPPMIDIFIQLVFIPEEKRDASVIEKAQKKLPNLLNTLDSHLKDKTYLTGDEFTLADLNVHSVVSICNHIKYDLSEYDSINKWIKNISERPAFKKYMKLCEQ